MRKHLVAAVLTGAMLATGHLPPYPFPHAYLLGHHAKCRAGFRKEWDQPYYYQGRHYLVCVKEYR